MKSAILYIRVSTDEQADKGYSQRNQEEVLRRYCEAKSITVLDTVFEDHSAKTFNRPAWKEMLKTLKDRKKTVKPNLLLFTKWDRFSRNTSDAYQTIALLNGIGVEPQAVEQPIDLSVPENKMMLAFYLAVPEVENDRRGLNIFYGIRRARKEGRWMGHAPVGYENKTTDDGRKYIRPNIPQARLMRLAFEELSTGRYAVQQVWKKYREMGLKTQSNNFHTAIRNPLYCGKILVPAHQDEKAHLVQGTHEPIIPENLFLKVQDILSGGKKARKSSISTQEHFTLRGYLKCERCNRMLTASSSKGRSGYYHYYHCSSKCGIRYTAARVNEALINLLASLQPNTSFCHLFKEILRDVYKQKNAGVLQQRSLAIQKTAALSARMEKVRAMLVEDQIDPADYQKIKTETDLKIQRLAEQIAASDNLDMSITKLLNVRKPLFLDLHNLYLSASSADKRKLLNEIFSGHIIYSHNRSFDNKFKNYIYAIFNLQWCENKDGSANFTLEEKPQTKKLKL